MNALAACIAVAQVDCRYEINLCRKQALIRFAPRKTSMRPYYSAATQNRNDERNADKIDSTKFSTIG